MKHCEKSGEKENKYERERERSNDAIYQMLIVFRRMDRRRKREDQKKKKREGLAQEIIQDPSFWKFI